MYKKESIPACYRYLETENRSHVLYTLASTMTKAGQHTLSAKEFLALLCATNLASVEDTLPVLLENVSCFSVVSNCKCGFICQLCIYSTRYKNKMVAEEEMLMAYCLKSYTNFQYLKNKGLTEKLFESLVLLNDFPKGKIVPTLPLLRLSYSFIEHTADKNLNFHELPGAIAGTLDRNNPGKLLPQNIQKIQDFLACLQKDYKGMHKEDAERLLDHCQNPFVDQLSSQSQAPTQASDLLKDTKSTCLTGLLHEKEQIISHENTKPISSPNKSKKPIQNISHVSAGDTPSAVEDNEALYLPTTFSTATSDAMQTGYAFHILDDNSFELHQFEAFLLYNPLLGLEVVTDSETKKNALLFCASNQFYYTFAEEENILKLLCTYLSKSSVRRQICLEPYRLYAFMEKNNLPYRNVYSLRTAYKILKTFQKQPYIKAPSVMIKELTSRTNQNGLSSHIFAMPCYEKMYHVLEANPILQKEEQREKFELLSGIDALLGISYDLKDIADTSSPLFNIDEQGEYQFFYTPDIKLRSGIYSITFHLSAPKPLNGLVIDLLYRLIGENLTKKFGYRLLRFSTNSFTLATTERNYPQLREIVINLSTCLAERKDLLPLIVNEEKHFSE